MMGISWRWKHLTRLITIFLALAFIFGTSGCGPNPEDAIDKKDSAALEKMYNEASDKAKMAESIRQAFLERAFKVIETKDNDGRIKREQELLKTVGVMRNHNTAETKWLINAYDDFTDVARSDKALNDAEASFYKQNGMRYDAIANKKVEVSQLSVYVASKVNRDDPKSTEFYCTGHKKLYSTFDVMQLAGLTGRVMDNPDLPDTSFECVLDYGDNKYVKSGVTNVTAILRGAQDFHDDKGFTQKLDVYQVVSSNIIEEIRDVTNKRAAFKAAKDAFKDNAMKGNSNTTKPPSASQPVAKQADSANQAQNKSAQQATPTANNSNSGGITSSQARNLADDYIAALNRRDFQAAYSKYSKDWQSDFAYETWRRGYDNTISQRITSGNVSNAGTNRATIEFVLESKDRTGSSGTITRRFQGTWDVIRENGKLVLDNPDVKVLN